MRPKFPPRQERAGTPVGRQPFFVALLPTCDRPRLLETRALPSIAAQRRLPDALIVVDDSSSPASRRRNERAACGFGEQSGVPVVVVPNRREKGASGAWNTGALEAAVRWDPGRAHLAFLDDDDEWLPNHLAVADAAIRRTAADFVAPAHERRTVQGCEIIVPPAVLDPRDFLVGNPGITGSFLIIRLSTFFEAGMHDEGLASCTDRDLCIRLSLLPGLRWLPLPETSARWIRLPGPVSPPGLRWLPLPETLAVQHAEEGRPRLSGFGDERRLAGLTRFAQKYRGWMIDGEYAAFCERAERLFGWRAPPKRASGIAECRKPAASRSARGGGAASGRIALVVAVIADPETGADGLWGDLLELSHDKRITSLDVVVVPAAGRGHGKIAKQLARRRTQGLRAFLVDVANLGGYLRGVLTSVSGSRPISVNRTIAQCIAARAATRYKDSVCWVLDGDCRLFALARDRQGVRRESPDYVGEMLRLKKSGCPAAVGEVTGPTPLPRAMSVRTQMVDLLHLLARAMGPGGGPSFAAGVPDIVADGDYHHDCIGRRHLEFPAGFDPLPVGTDRKGLLRALPGLVRRILVGDSPTRPLLRGEAGTAIRGGNTLIFDMDAALGCPNGFAFGCLAGMRRQDEAWRVLNRALFGREIGGGDFPVAQVRAGDEPQAPDLFRLTEDVAGRAFVGSLSRVVGRRRFPSPEKLLAAMSAAGFADAVRKVARERTEELAASFHRIRGLAESMRGMLPAGRECRAADAALEEVARRFSPDIAKKLSRRVERRLGEIVSPDACAKFPDFFRHCTEVEESDLADWRRWHLGERDKNARALMARLFPEVRGLRFLGSGSEGTVFAKGDIVYKVLHRWESRRIVNPGFLPSLVGKQGGNGSLYPVLGWQCEGGDAVLTRPFEKTAPYRGGCGAGLTALLSEMLESGVLHRNIHPNNLRRLGRQVRAIDYGGSIRPFAEKSFDLVVRRMWLVWRWNFRTDLQQLLTASRADAGLPELRGYERMAEAARRFAAFQRPPDDAFEEVVRGRPKRVLDFGCGKGKQALELAARGMQVAAWDPGMEKSVAQELRAAGIRVAESVDDLRGEDPFDTVLLRHVLCEIRSDSDFRKCLADIRGLIAPRGRLVAAMCSLDGLVRDTTCAVNIFPRGADIERKFAYRKRLRALGTVRAHVHRPESAVLREFARAGFAVVGRREFPDIDLSRFEPCGGVVRFTLEPLPPAPPVTLIVRACAMEAGTLEHQVRHLVGQLGSPRGFAQVMLALDDRRRGFLRQHTAGDLRVLAATAERLKAQGWVDRIVFPPREKSALRAQNRRWVGPDCAATHSLRGVPMASVFAAFDACKTPYALHIDADMTVGRTDARHDYLGVMLGAMQGRGATTMGLNFTDADNSPARENSGPPFRVEVCAGLTDLRRLRGMRPLPNRIVRGMPALPWHRAADRAIRASGSVSLRGGDQRLFVVHPPNSFKDRRDAWDTVYDRAEKRLFPPRQRKRKDWDGVGWVAPERTERFVFVVCGRDVSRGRIDRCLDSMLAQRIQDWGAVIIDDASRPGLAAHLRDRVAEHPGRFSHFLRRRRAGGLANLAFAVRNFCADPESVIVTLDLDDALLGGYVLDVLAEAYDGGADVTAGSVLRTDKETAYHVCFDNPRANRGGGVSLHLRSFRKRLFDQIPDSVLRDADGGYYRFAGDWPYMLPIVEAAKSPVWIRRPLYLYEPSSMQSAAYKAVRAKTVERIVNAPAKEAR